MSSPYDGIEMPKPPKGYRLAEWGEIADNADWWCMGGWVGWGSTNSHNCYELDYPEGSIFAIPKPRVSIPLVPVTNSFEDFKASVEAKYGHPHLRDGQIAYNELYTARVDIADWVWGYSGLDPFYYNSNLPAFWECVKERWDQ